LFTQDKEMASKIINNLNLQVPPRELKQTDARLVIYSIMSKWLPLSTSVLGNEPKDIRTQ